MTEYQGPIFKVTPHLASDLDLMPEIAKQVRHLLETVGPSAFEMPKSAASAHEVGHAIQGTIEGLDIKAVYIHDHGNNNWTGVTYERTGDWRIEIDTTPLAEVMARIKFLAAGVLGEFVFRPAAYRPGSSLDEIMTGQALCATLLNRYPEAYPGVVHPAEIWRERITEPVCRVLKNNEALADEMIERLSRFGRLRGKTLAAFLARVRTLDAGGVA